MVGTCLTAYLKSSVNNQHLTYNHFNLKYQHSYSIIYIRLKKISFFAFSIKVLETIKINLYMMYIMTDLKCNNHHNFQLNVLVLHNILAVLLLWMKCIKYFDNEDLPLDISQIIFWILITFHIFQWTKLYCQVAVGRRHRLSSVFEWQKM